MCRFCKSTCMQPFIVQTVTDYDDLDIQVLLANPSRELHHWHIDMLPMPHRCGMQQSTANAKPVCTAVRVYHSHKC